VKLISEPIVIERIRDIKLVKMLATHGAIFPHVSDDWTKKPEEWDAPQNDSIVYLVASDGRIFFGFSVFMPQTWTCYQAHLGFLPSSYGEMALTAFKEMLGWMWRNSTASRIVGEICAENRRAIAFSKRAGFEEYGVNQKSYLRGGVLRDQVCLGISKP
jgi:RimJ/RimL family protein N-acetyltransferase